MLTKTNPPLTTPAQEQERLQRAWDYWREEIASGFDTRNLEENNHEND